MAGWTVRRHCGHSQTAATSRIACSSPTRPPPSPPATGRVRAVFPSGIATGRNASPSRRPVDAERLRCRPTDGLAVGSRGLPQRPRRGPVPSRRRDPVRRRPLRRWGIRGDGPASTPTVAGPAWSTISNSPPARTAPAACLRIRGRSNGIMECRNCAEIRSNVPSGKLSDRSCWTNSMRSLNPWDSAAAAARCNAVSEMSTATTVQPRSASQHASAPSPQPRSSARPASNGDTTSARRTLTRPLQTRSRSP